MENIRNIAIIAHIDHGKSTLADRILERAGSIEKRRMRERMLDRMDLERERGITIKMQPVSVSIEKGGTRYALNIIDTPGHIDFSYEVSRSLRAVEGALLLVDSTRGAQAQTLSVLEIARDLGLTVIPVLSKIDMPAARVGEISREMIGLLGCAEEDICPVSGKTGEGVDNLLNAIIERVPAPREDPGDGKDGARALVFDFSYDDHTGITAFTRVCGGSFSVGDRLIMRGAGQPFSLKDVGMFMPDMKSTGEASAGMVAYFTTGIKEPGVAIVGDTITRARSGAESFPGYRQPDPVIWASLYPRQANESGALHRALRQMRLTDAALAYEEEQSTVFGKGFRCGFLGMLHLEIITERIRREAGVDLVITAPTADVTVTGKNGEKTVIASPSRFPDAREIESVEEPWVSVESIVPAEYVPAVSRLIARHEGRVIGVNDFRNNRCVVRGEMPLREMMRKFFDRLKNVSSGHASCAYKKTGNRPANVTRLDILLAGEVFPAFSDIVSRSRVAAEARELAEILKENIPRAMFEIRIQARADGKVIASETLPALRKDVTAKLYGGDVTRKMKLREKQKKGKRKMGAIGSVSISHETFMKVIQKRAK